MTLSENCDNEPTPTRGMTRKGKTSLLSAARAQCLTSKSPFFQLSPPEGPTGRGRKSFPGVLLGNRETVSGKPQFLL